MTVDLVIVYASDLTRSSQCHVVCVDPHTYCESDAAIATYPVATAVPVLSVAIALPCCVSICMVPSSSTVSNRSVRARMASSSAGVRKALKPCTKAGTGGEGETEGEEGDGEDGPAGPVDDSDAISRQCGVFDCALHDWSAAGEGKMWVTRAGSKFAVDGSVLAISVCASPIDSMRGGVDCGVGGASVELFVGVELVCSCRRSM